MVGSHTSSVRGVRDTRNSFSKLTLFDRRSLSTDDRVKYIEAVKCLMNKPAETSTDDVPGVTNRFEDFLGTHIIQADDVHFVVCLP